MIISVFNFTKYKPYLLKKIAFISKEDRTLRRRLAEHIQCQPSYLSQVLNGKPDLTLEQAHRLNQFFHHDKDESRYFILLVELERANTHDLKNFFREQIQDSQTLKFNLKKRLKETDDIPIDAQHKYYSAWFYSAIHIALAIPELQSPTKIAIRFNLPEDLVVGVVKFLEANGLVEVVGNSYKFTKRHIHLDRTSEFIQRHHINWRSQTLQSVEKNLLADLHYSNVCAISRSDFDKIKDMLIEALNAVREVTKPSQSEDLCAITLDVFRL